jgi:hypothetical protein
MASSFIKRYIKIPFNILPFKENDAFGKKTFSSQLDALCYPIDDLKVIRTDFGTEVVSATQLYIDGLTTIDVIDEVIYGGKQHAIQHIGTYYDTNGKALLKVVYL